MTLSEAAAKAIDLAKAIRDYWDAELPKRHPHYPIVSLDEDSGPAPPEQIELRRFLESLPDEQLYELLLIMYLGRGDFGTNDLGTTYETLRNRFPRREGAISQMEEKAPLADYLADGLADLRKSGIDPDRMTVAALQSE